ncbi:unnamed protein product [Durusdinium trenchii]
MMPSVPPKKRKFIVTVITNPGDQVYLTGDTDELGNWNLDYAIQMKTEDGFYPRWWCEVSLDSSPLQIIHYKYVLVQNNGEPVWEPRLNRSLESNDRELDDGEFGEDSAGDSQKQGSYIPFHNFARTEWVKAEFKKMQKDILDLKQWKEGKAKEFFDASERNQLKDLEESLQDFKYNSDRQLSDLNLGLRRLESQHKDVSKQLEQQPSEAKLRQLESQFQALDEHVTAKVKEMAHLQEQAAPSDAMARQCAGRGGSACASSAAPSKTSGAAFLDTPISSLCASVTSDEWVQIQPAESGYTTTSREAPKSKGAPTPNGHVPTINGPAPVTSGHTILQNSQTTMPNGQISAPGPLQNKTTLPNGQTPVPNSLQTNPAMANGHTASQTPMPRHAPNGTKSSPPSTWPNQSSGPTRVTERAHAMPNAAPKFAFTQTPKPRVPTRSPDGRFQGMDQPTHPEDAFSKGLTAYWEKEFFMAKKNKKTEEERKILLREAQLKLLVLSGVQFLLMRCCLADWAPCRHMIVTRMPYAWNAVSSTNSSCFVAGIGKDGNRVFDS